MRTDYTIETQTGTRMVGGITEGCELREEAYTTYRILRNEVLVGIVYDHADIETAIETMEKWPGVGRVIGSRFD